MFLVLIVLLAALLARITSNVFDQQRDEIDQRANAMLAADMAKEIQPYLTTDSDAGQIGSAIHYMMVLNPLIEIYLLSGDGTILSFFADTDTALQTNHVALGPIEGYLSGEQALPVYGEDPRRPEQPSTFSVAALTLSSGRQGYLYVILRSSLYDSARSEIEDDYYRAALRKSLLFTLPFVTLLGLVLFSFLTLRLRKLTEVVRRFGSDSGAYGVRAAVASRDEIGELARSFNTMASRIEEAETRRRDLVANISHDIRTPLAVINGYTETLLEKGARLSIEERTQYLEISLASVKSISRLVDDLFALSKLEAHDHTLNPEEFSLSELCQDLVMQMKPLAENHQVHIHLESPSELLSVSGDISMLERVLANLIDNALRYSPENSRIVLSLVKTNSNARVTVTDSGPGMSQDQQARVFDRFYTGDPSRSSGHSGLGLAIARRIVELHGGTIGVSGSPGKGSSFFFEIPLLQR